MIAEMPMDDMEDAAAPAAPAAPAEPAPVETTVLLTVNKNADGTFQLITGDEPEPGAEDAEPAGEQFDAPGPLLKAILDIIRGAGASTGEAEFNEGFTGSAAPTPKTPPAV